MDTRIMHSNEESVQTKLDRIAKKASTDKDSFPLKHWGGFFFLLITESDTVIFSGYSGCLLLSPRHNG